MRRINPKLNETDLSNSPSDIIADTTTKIADERNIVMWDPAGNIMDCIELNLDEGRGLGWIDGCWVYCICWCMVCCWICGCPGTNTGLCMWTCYHDVLSKYGCEKYAVENVFMLPALMSNWSQRSSDAMTMCRTRHGNEFKRMVLETGASTTWKEKNVK